MKIGLKKLKNIADKMKNDINKTHNKFEEPIRSRYVSHKMHLSEDVKNLNEKRRFQKDINFK